MSASSEVLLFGGDKGWTASDWIASDDTVRGGNSRSSLLCEGSTARFYGTLDIKALGGAGFASQRTTSDVRSWDLSIYDGISIGIVAPSDSNSPIIRKRPERYTFIVKDTILPKNPQNGREQATINYEYDFSIHGESNLGEKSGSIFIPWKSLRATYRGKPKRDAPALDLEHIKRFSIMVRSFFGEQEGDFSLTLKFIKAVNTHKDLEGEQLFSCMKPKRALLLSRLALPFVLMSSIGWACYFLYPWFTWFKQ